jgi:predicted helicase
MVEFYNEQLSSIKLNREKGNSKKIDDLIDTNPTKISWSRGLKRSLENLNLISIDKSKLGIYNYRPFSKQNVYHSKSLNEYVYQWAKFLPTGNHNNVFICISSSGTTNGLSLLISTSIVDAHFNGDTQCFPLYYYEENTSKQQGLFDDGNDQDFIQRDAISDFILERAKKQYGKNVSKEDVFYYVYGFLHSKEYREMFANDLKKMLPRLPLVEDVRDFWKFSKAGRALAELHLNYETVAPFVDVNVSGDDGKFYTVEKMRFPKKDQKDTINYNSKISITNIPAKAYEYVVNGKSAIEWIMERYAVTTHKESQITNNPNDWAEEVGNPRYILDLLLSIINVSIQTVDIVNGLPKIDFGAETSEGKEVKLYPTREEGDNMSIAAEPKLNE